MKNVKCFLTDDEYILNQDNMISEVYEISDYCLTFSKNRKYYTSSIKQNLSLHVFTLEGASELMQQEVNDIIKVADEFKNFLTASILTDKQNIISTFIHNFTINNPNKTVTNFNYNIVVSYLNIRTVDYLSFTLNNDISVNMWLKNNTFKELFPDYAIDIVFPFDNFVSLLNNTSSFINKLNNFNYIQFNNRIEENKEYRITTITRILNIPYKIPNTNITKDCYFAFNIYGQQGDYDQTLRISLLQYLENFYTSTQITEMFPTLMQINEFFITPRWLNVAIPSHVGQSAINSQVTKSFNEEFDLTKFIKHYPEDHLRNNTYNLPFDHNNMLFLVTNGFYTESAYRDFKSYYSDIITVTSLDPDFGRMSLKTQRFVTLVENMLVATNVSNSTELLNKVITNTQYQFRIRTQNTVTYLVTFFDKHYYYMIPKYEYIRLNV